MTNAALVLIGLNILYVGTLLLFTVLVQNATAKARELHLDLHRERRVSAALEQRTKQAEDFAERVAGHRSTDPPIPPRVLS